MVFTVFISHSKADVDIVKKLHSALEQSGIKVYVAEFYPEPGKLLSEKVTKQIELSDCFLVLLTQEGVKSNWVQQEIGVAKQAKRLIIPVVEKGIKITGLLEGVERIELDRENLWNTIESINNYATHLKVKKEQAEEAARASATVAGIAILAIFVGLLFVAAASAD